MKMLLFVVLLIFAGVVYFAIFWSPAKPVQAEPKTKVVRPPEPTPEQKAAEEKKLVEAEEAERKADEQKAADEKVAQDKKLA